MHLSQQARIVLDHLRGGSHLTSWQAEGVYRIRRLASRIDELRAAGYGIDTETAKDAQGQRYTRYSLSINQLKNQRPVNKPRVRNLKVTTDQIEISMDRLGFSPRDIEDVIADLRGEDV